MYKFRLHVTNMHNGCQRTINIAIDDTGINADEKTVYMYAMSKAYDIVRSMTDYSFDKLVFISC